MSPTNYRHNHRRFPPDFLTSQSASSGRTAVQLKRDVAVLALRLVDAFGLEHAEGADQLGAGLAGLDDVVDVAALRRRVGVGEVSFVVVDQFLAALVGGRRVGDVFAVDDVDGALGAHYGDLGGRPGDVVVGQHVLGVHHVVGAAVGLAGDDGELRHRRLGEGVEELGAVADDPVPLLVGAGEEAGDVGEGEDRDVVAIAGAHEPGRLLG